MAVRSLVTAPGSFLKQVSKPVAQIDEEIHTLVQDMFDTMYEEKGIGLAAIQIGVPKRIVVMDLAGGDEESQPRAFINPEILELSEETTASQEGCLSVPGYVDTIDRSLKCRVRYLNAEGETTEEWAEGLYAICFQHELDHLNGILFIDHLSRLKRDRVLTGLKKTRRLESMQA